MRLRVLRQRLSGSYTADFSCLCRSTVVFQLGGRLSEGEGGPFCFARSPVPPYLRSVPKNSAGNSGRRGPGVPFKKGGDPRQGRCPKGKGGRPSIVIREECRGLVEKFTLPRIAAYLKDKAKTPDDQGFRWCHEQLVKVGIARQELGLEEVVQLAGLLTTLALHCITDEKKRQEFAEGCQSLSAGEPVDLGSGVTLHVR